MLEQYEIPSTQFVVFFFSGENMFYQSQGDFQGIALEMLTLYYTPHPQKPYQRRNILVRRNSIKFLEFFCR
jgi:hypothetical protein